MISIAVIAAVLLMIRLISRTEPPTKSLASEIARFNSQAQENEVGSLEPLLTEKEVLTAIQSQLPNLIGRPQVKQIYQRIFDTGLLPADASLHFIAAWKRNNVPKQIVWWINLEIKTGTNRGYGLRIRENMQPAFAQTKVSN